MTWRQHAACFGAPTEWFFSDNKSHLARALCENCTVKADCYEDAITQREAHGIRGGVAMGEVVHHIRRRNPCRWCGELFTGRRITFCSDDCAYQAALERDRRSVNTTHKIRPCRWCGESMKGGEHYDEGYCGWVCRRSHKRQLAREALA